MAADLADRPADPSIVGEGPLGDGGARLESARGFASAFPQSASSPRCPSARLSHWICVISPLFKCISSRSTRADVNLLQTKTLHCSELWSKSPPPHFFFFYFILSSSSLPPSSVFFVSRSPGFNYKKNKKEERLIKWEECMEITRPSSVFPSVLFLHIYRAQQIGHGRSEQAWGRGF